MIAPTWVKTKHTMQNPKLQFFTLKCFSQKINAFVYELVLCDRVKDEHLHQPKRPLLFPFSCRDKVKAMSTQQLSSPIPNGALNSKSPVKASNFLKSKSSAQLLAIQEYWVSIWITACNPSNIMWMWKLARMLVQKHLLSTFDSCESQSNSYHHLPSHRQEGKFLLRAVSHQVNVYFVSTL